MIIRKKLGTKLATKTGRFIELLSITMFVAIIAFLTLLCVALLTGSIDAVCTPSITFGEYISGGPGISCETADDCCSKICDFADFPEYGDYEYGPQTECISL
ncbi:uncharacterized protein LOC117175163 [Belonocnema kinseyi]|uniref:uncharacterized protein LOC117175163 n=1 Tax=Belonocnema kinseyi TaxID=2817044 RepID=UPI00143CFE6A|nr:uncharacterized protein LOC117175163 [Belonocnema kinseyi]